VVVRFFAQLALSGTLKKLFRKHILKQEKMVVQNEKQQMKKTDHLKSMD